MRNPSSLEAVRAFIFEIAARRASTRRPGVILRVDPLAVAAVGPLDETLCRFVGPPVEAMQAAAEWINRASGTTVGLEFATGLTVADTFVLPAESEDVLRAIVRNKVEGFAPWPVARTLVGQRVKRIDGDSAHVIVDAAVVSRSLVEEISEQLGKFSITIVAVSACLTDGETVPTDFQVSDEHRSLERRAIRVGVAVGMLALSVLTLGLFLDWRAYSEGSYYREEGDRLMAKLHTSADEGGSPLLQSANALYSERAQRPPAVVVLNELSKLLPDNVWLNSITLDDTKLELKGQGRDVPSLIKLLEASDILGDANFSSATQHIEELQTETFAIEAVLQPNTRASSP